MGTHCEQTMDYFCSHFFTKKLEFLESGAAWWTKTPVYGRILNRSPLAAGKTKPKSVIYLACIYANLYFISNIKQPNGNFLQEYFTSGSLDVTPEINAPSQRMPEVSWGDSVYNYMGL